MAEEIAFENGRISNFEGLVILTLDRVIIHTVVHHSSTSTYIPISLKSKKLFVDEPLKKNQLYYMWTLSNSRPKRREGKTVGNRRRRGREERRRWKRRVGEYREWKDMGKEGENGKVREGKAGRGGSLKKSPKTAIFTKFSSLGVLYPTNPPPNLCQIRHASADLQYTLSCQILP